MWKEYRLGAVATTNSQHSKDNEERVRRLVEAAHHHVPGAFVSLIGLHPLLGKLPHKESSLLCEGTLCSLRQWGPGQKIIHKGDACESIFYILHGECSERLADKTKTGLATVRAGGVFGAGKLFSAMGSGANDKAVRRKDYQIFETTLVTGAMGAVTVEINQVHAFSLFSTPVLSSLRDAAALSYRWRKRRQLEHGLENSSSRAEEKALHGDCSGNSEAVIQARVSGKRANPTVNLGTLVMIRAGVGQSSEALPRRLIIPGFEHRIAVQALEGGIDGELHDDACDDDDLSTETAQPVKLGQRCDTDRLSTKPTSVSTVEAERRNKGLATARRPLPSDEDLSVPQISGGRIATKRTLGLLARSVWQLRGPPNPETREESTVFVPIAPSTARRASGPLTGVRRPMTKRINYHAVPWLGPRVNMEKKWRDELKPRTRGKGNAGLSSIDAVQKSHEDSVEKGVDGRLGKFLDAEMWPALSRAGVSSRIRYAAGGKAKRRRRGRKKRRKKDTTRKVTLPSLSIKEGVPGPLINIGGSYYPVPNKRMR